MYGASAAYGAYELFPVPDHFIIKKPAERDRDSNARSRRESEMESVCGSACEREVASVTCFDV